MDVLDIFYNHIIKEAATGRIYCGLHYNILFETYLVETEEKIQSNIEYDDTLVPTLIIENREEFNEILQKYVDYCMNFYDNFKYYPEEVENPQDLEKYKICKEKLIMTHLWSNATYEDFKDPINFLCKRMAFLESNISEISHELGFSPTLDGDINLEIKKGEIYNETPYNMEFKVVNKKGDIYIFPEIKFGIADDIVYIYAIKNNSNIESEYAQKIKDTVNNVGKGVTPSFLVSLNMAVSYLHSLGFTKIVVPSVLISRWNAKKIGVSYLRESNNEKVSKIEELLNDQERIQQNLTEKFLRTFILLTRNYENINITSMPFELDSNLHLIIDGELITNNAILNETANLVKITTKNKNI